MREGVLGGKDIWEGEIRRFECLRSIYKGWRCETERVYYTMLSSERGSSAFSIRSHLERDLPRWSSR